MYAKYFKRLIDFSSSLIVLIILSPLLVLLIILGAVFMKGNPFFLDEEGENWVLDTWKNMSLEQKCGQVFCPMGFNGEEETLKHFTQDIQVGGLMYRADSAENIQDIYRKLQAFSNIPLLRAANT